MPTLVNKSDKEAFTKRILYSVGAIDRLQHEAETLRQRAQEPLSVRGQLTAEERILYDEMKKPTAKRQRWSDGLVFFCSLQTETVKCPMNAVYEIFLLGGALCFLGLANKRPIRGAIETAWGVELHEGELYGAVVARSYELENGVAQYPRIVIGPNTVEYLRAYSKQKPDPENRLELYNRNLAVMCNNMIAIDQDGYHIVDYLGQTFTETVTQEESRKLYDAAYRYICEQYATHKLNRNTKLALRYTWARGYFHANRERHSGSR